MLDPNAIKLAIGLTQDYSNRGVTLDCVPDTPMSMICRETPLEGVFGGGEFTYESASKLLVDLSRCPEHASALAEMKTLGVTAVRNTLDFTRNTVNPHIRKVIEAYAEAMEGSEIVPLPYDVDHVMLPEIYMSQAGRSFVESWEDVATATSPGAVDFGSYDISEIEKLVSLTESEGFNDLTAALLADNNSAGYRAIADVLSGRTDVESIEVNFTLPLAIALRNIETPKEGVKMTLDQYKTNRSLVSNVAAKRALRIINQQTQAQNSSALYPGVGRSAPGMIRVNSAVYSDMLEKGLTIEALIGNELLGRKYYGSKLLDPKNIEELTSVYERDRATRQQAHAIDLKSRERAMIQKVLRDDLNGIANNNAFPIEGDTGEKAWSRLKGFVDKLFENKFANYEPTAVIAGTICFVWYSHTDAARLIDIIFEVEKRNSGMAKADLATLATLQYLCAWVVSQLVIRKPEL